MAKYEVRIELLLRSADLATYTVEANSPEDAKSIATQAFDNGDEPNDRWASDWLESEVDEQYIDTWEVTKL